MSTETETKTVPVPTPSPTVPPPPAPTPTPRPPIPGESALKETYLQLLPHPVLVSLVLALDRNHDAVIWPTDLPSAIDSLREYAKRLYAPSKTPIAPIAPAALPPSVGPHGNNNANGPNRPQAAMPSSSSSTSVPPAARHLPTQIIPRIPGGPPQPTPVPSYGTPYANSSYPSGSGPPRIPPHRNQTGRPPNGPGSGGMPSYEEMIVAALEELSEPDGLAPKTVFDYMGSHWSLMSNFRPSASQALQKAYKRGRLEKVGGKYRLNPSWEGGNTSKRTTRRPQMGETDSSTPPTAVPSPAYPFPWSKPTAIPSSATPYPSTRYPFTQAASSSLSLPRAGASFASFLPSATRPGLTNLSKSSTSGKSLSLNSGNLVRIKQEPGDDEDELENGTHAGGSSSILTRVGASSSAPPMTIRETLLKLSQLLADSVTYANGDTEHG